MVPKTSTKQTQISILKTHTSVTNYRNVNPLTPRDRIDAGSSSEVSKICTSPVSGSSISPVSPATFDLKLAKTSAAAVSN